MKSSNIKIEKRKRRHKRIRARISGTADAPRLSVFKSNRSLYAQLIDDERGITLAAISDSAMKGKTKTERAAAAGAHLAGEAKKKKIGRCRFDRGGFSYRGRIAAFAKGAREGGLAF